MNATLITPLFTASAAASILALTAGCDAGDIGKECEGMDIPVEETATADDDIVSVQGSEIVEYNLDFPCESAVCIATLGRGGYCSKECIESSDCPKGFTCRQVMDMGSFKDSKYCAWAQCSKDSDCQAWKMACTRVDAESLGGEEVKLCGWRK